MGLSHDDQITGVVGLVCHFDLLAFTEIGLGFDAGANLPSKGVAVEDQHRDLSEVVVPVDVLDTGRRAAP